jgi:hypothetical protein
MAGVGRVHVRCSAPPEEEPRALRTRDRLVRTARVHLPAALEHALAGGRPERRVFAERVTVALDFDPDDYDDVTTALLWAGRVRRALDDERSLASSPAAVEVFEDDREFFGRAALAFASTGELPWIYEELACGAGRPSIRAFLSSFDTRARVAAFAAALERRRDAAAALWERLDASEREAVVEALEGGRAWGDWSEPVRRSGSERADEPGATAPRGRRPAPAAGRSAAADDAVRPQGPEHESPIERSPEPAANGFERFRAALTTCARTGAAAVRHRGELRAAARQEAEAPRTEPSRPPRSGPDAGASSTAEALGADRLDEPVAPESEPDVETAERPGEAEAWWSHAGGLVLLYPWLADLLAEETEPGCELTFRLRALAAVAAPGAEEALLSDPLVRVLAGDDPGTSFRRQVPPREAEALRERADGVVRSFAACLPGFERSSPEYLRRYLLDRGALVARLRDGGFGARLEPAPLDPVLVRLPYPIASFRFAWSEPISVELRDA